MSSRFRYSLRTLFIVVTLIACWLGWQERKSYLADHRTTHCAFNEMELKSSRLRERLGDQAYTVIGLPANASKQERAEAAAMFPEAEIKAINPRFHGKTDGAQPFGSFPDEE